MAKALLSWSIAACQSCFAINCVALSNSLLAFLGTLRSAAETVAPLALAAEFSASGCTLTKTDWVLLRSSTSKLSLCVVRIRCPPGVGPRTTRAEDRGEARAGRVENRGGSCCPPNAPGEGRTKHWDDVTPEQMSGKEKTRSLKKDRPETELI